jgi:kumamolisin
LKALVDSHHRGAGRHMSREEFDQRFAAAPADIDAVKEFAQRHGLSVVRESPPRRVIVLAGTVQQCNDAFGVDLENFAYPGGSYRGRTGVIHLPDELNGVVEAVLGLDNRPQARPRFRVRPASGSIRPRAAEGGSFTPLELASLYDFPAGDGRGQCIGVIELGGGYRPEDLQAYFAELGVNPPYVSAVSVGQGGNEPTGDPNGPDAEVMLDIEIAGAIAPAATIAVYFAPNTDAGFLNAITTAIHDTTNKPSVISISWGAAESAWTQQSLTAYDEAFQAAAALGITICAAAGDNGSSDGVGDGADHVDFPASSPHCLACGGTRLQASNGTITSEVVWNDGVEGGATGGGISTAFPFPQWQSGLKVTRADGSVTVLSMRGVPDVSGDADPQTGYAVRVDGQDTVIGGTSAVAPLWAGLIARINAANGTPLGLIQPLLYGNPTAMRDVTEGNNGSFTAAPMWDACTGLGSPDGRKIGPPAVA